MYCIFPGTPDYYSNIASKNSLPKKNFPMKKKKNIIWNEQSTVHRKYVHTCTSFFLHWWDFDSFLPFLPHRNQPYMINLDVRAQFWEVFHITLQGNESFSFLVVCNKTQVFHFAWNAMQEFLKKFSLLHTLYAMVFFCIWTWLCTFLPVEQKNKNNCNLCIKPQHARIAHPKMICNVFLEMINEWKNFIFLLFTLNFCVLNVSNPFE